MATIASMMIGAGVDTSDVRIGAERAVRILEGALKAMATKGSATKILSAEQLAAQGVIAAKALTDAMERTFVRDVADAKEALFRGLINHAEFRDRGRAAAQSFNAGILTGIEQLGAGGRLTPALNTALVGSLKQQALLTAAETRAMAQAASQATSTIVPASAAMSRFGGLISATGTQFTTLGRRAAPAITSISFGLESMARGIQAGESGARAALRSVSDFAFAFGPVGIVVSAVTAGGLALFSFWRRQREEAEKSAKALTESLLQMRRSLSVEGLSGKATELFAGTSDELGQRTGGIQQLRAQKAALDAVVAANVSAAGVVTETGSQALHSLIPIEAKLASMVAQHSRVMRVLRDVTGQVVDQQQTAARLAAPTAMERLADRVKLLTSAVADAVVGTEFWRSVIAQTSAVMNEVAVSLEPFGSAVTEQTVALRGMATQLEDNITKLLQFQSLAKLPALALGGLSRPSVTAEVSNSLSRLPEMAGVAKASSAFAALAPVAESLLASLGPLAAVSAVISGMFQVLGPAVQAFLTPFAVVGQVLGAFLVPYLRLLFPVLKGTGIGLAVLGEVIARVAGFISQGIGQLLVGIGKLLNLLPGSIGNPIIRAGRSMLQFSSDMRESAREMADARKDLSRLTFDEAMAGVTDLGNAASQAAEALRNVPAGYRVALARFEATNPVSLPGGGSVPAGSSGSVININAPMTVQTAAKSAEALFADIAKAAQQRSRALFGTTVRAADTLALSGT